MEFGLAKASLSRELVRRGESVVLSWESRGGEQLDVRSEGELLFSTSDPALVDRGSITLFPERTSTYSVELRSWIRTEVLEREIQVERVSISTAVTTSSEPGAAVTLSWTLDRHAPEASFHLALPMEELSGPSFADYDLARDPEATTVIAPTLGEWRRRLDLDGFSFPFFGDERDFVYVSVDGYLSWDPAPLSPSNTPIASRTASVEASLLAPFWESLHPRGRGVVLAKQIDEARYVIQWSDLSLTAGSLLNGTPNHGSLNFLVVLHRCGDFEFHFGPMLPPPHFAPDDCSPMSCINETNGSSATIGYQVAGGVAGHQIHHGAAPAMREAEPVPGGLSGRSWRFRNQSQDAGTVVVHPTESTHYRLCAYEAQVGEVSCAPPVGVDVPWGIDLFRASPQAPSPSEEVRLSWSVHGLDSLRILANGVAIETFDAPIPLIGTLPHTPTETTRYTLEGSSLGREVRAEVEVARRTFDLEIVAPAGPFFPGEVVEVEWELRPHVSGDPIVFSPMSELDAAPGADGFQDISLLPGAEELHLDLQNRYSSIPLPFPFPYFGSLRNDVRVYVAGYLSFYAELLDYSLENAPFPTVYPGQRHVHLAPFWDDLLWHGEGSIWRYSPDPQTLILQWKGFSPGSTSTAVHRYDLEFQAVLRADGSFDFRYGAMEPPPAPFSHPSCKPSSCEAVANGAGATIGYQEMDGRFGMTLHHGTSGSVSSGLAFPGGLSHRSFRFSPTSSGSARVVATRSEALQLCAILRDFSECEAVPLEVVAEPGDLAITELMIDPARGPAGQWFEVRNLNERTIDLQGFTLRTSRDSHLIAASLLIPPGGFVTLAASSDVMFSPSYVYGEDLPLHRLIETLELRAGTQAISSLSWDLDWEIPFDRSLSLDPSLHSSVSRGSSSFDGWCLGNSMGTPAATGDGCLDPHYAIELFSDRPFIDIAQTGTRFFEIDDSFDRLPIHDAEFRLFGEVYRQLWVSSAGWISFTDPGRPSLSFFRPPAALPRPIGLNDAPPPLVAPFWSQLRCANRCRIFYERKLVAEDSVLIVQWEDFRIGDASGSITFQVQLWSKGDVVFAFGGVDNPHQPWGPDWLSYRGNEAWIGLESADPALHSTASFRLPLGLEQRSIHFRPR